MSLTTHDTRRAREWLRESNPGKRTGYDEGVVFKEGVFERMVDGNAREDMYVETVRYRSLFSALVYF